MVFWYFTACPAAMKVAIVISPRLQLSGFPSAPSASANQIFITLKMID
jgi:hypothetical protein